MMTAYKSASGKQSGVLAFETGTDFILIEFNNKKKYRYSYMSTGSKAVEEMKIRALSSEGLSTYISRNRPLHERKNKSILKKLLCQLESLFV